MESRQRNGKKRTKRELSCFEEKLSKKSKRRRRSLVHDIDQKEFSTGISTGEEHWLQWSSYLRSIQLVLWRSVPLEGLKCPLKVVYTRKLYSVEAVECSEPKDSAQKCEMVDQVWWSEFNIDYIYVYMASLHAWSKFYCTIVILRMCIALNRTTFKQCAKDDLSKCLLSNQSCSEATKNHWPKGLLLSEGWWRQIETTVDACTGCSLLFFK